VTGVEVDREFAFATVYVFGPVDEREALAALGRARGYLRSQLAAKIPMRTFPQLRFRWDASSERGGRIDELLDQLKSERGSEQPD
jgi:ribosome-binding factor A